MKHEKGAKIQNIISIDDRDMVLFKVQQLAFILENLIV